MSVGSTELIKERRRRHDRTTEGRPMSVVERPLLEEQVTLVELVDRVLNAGVVLSGDITLAVADVDLVYVGLRVLLASVGTLDRLAAEAEV
jgi:hypothetical protein